MTVADLKARADKILSESNTLLTGQHFVYIHGDHGSAWVNKDAILPRIDIINELAAMIAEATESIAADVICGPAIGGLVMAQWVAFHRRLPAVFTEHRLRATAYDGTMRPPFELKRGFGKLVNGKRVLVVDDIINTGHSIKQTVAAVAEAGGILAGAAAYCTRGHATAQDLQVPTLTCLTEIDLPSWPAADCALCKEGVPINTEYAHGADYLESLKLPVSK